MRFNMDEIQDLYENTYDKIADVFGKPLVDEYDLVSFEGFDFSEIDLDDTRPEPYNEPSEEWKFEVYT